MSINLPSLYVSQFAMNVQLLLQQKESRLRGRITSGSYKGKQASPVDQIGAIAMQSVTGRFAPIGRVDAKVDRRWVTPSDFDLAQLIDEFDKLKMLIDPQSSYVQNAHHAANRQIDDLIITSFFGSALTGETGTISTTFPGAQQVAANAGAASNTNLTVAKLRAAKKKLRAAEVDLENDPVTVVISAEQEDSLMAEAQVISLDYNDKPVLVEGRIMRFLGMDFVHSERLPVDGSGYRRVPVFAKSGMHVGIWNDVTTNVTQRTDLSSQPWQAYVKLSAGATRLEEKKIVEIKCDES
jgi:hypothetical protein